MKILIEKFKHLQKNKYIFWAAIIKLLISAVGVAIFFLGSTPAEAAFGLEREYAQVKTSGNPNIYYLDHKRQVKKLYINEKAFLSYGNNWNKVKNIYDWEISQWPDAHLIKTANDRAVYYINSGNKALIKNEEDFSSFGFKQEDVITVTKADLNSYKTVDYRQAGLIFYTANGSSLPGGGNSTATNQSPTPNIYVYTNKEVKEKRFVKGQQNIMLASFNVEVPAGKEINISKITLADNAGSINTVSNANGFNNLRTYINDSRSQNTISKPSGNVYAFENINARINGGNRAEIKIYGNTDINLKISQAQLKLASITIKEVGSNQEMIIAKINTASEKIYFGETKAELKALAGGNVVSNTKKNKVGNFSIKNNGEETISLGSIVLTTSNEGFSKSVGYNNLAIVSKRKNEKIGNIENPVAGANKLSLNDYYLDPGQEDIFEVIVDSKNTSIDSFWLSFSGLEARGIKTSRKLNIKGDPTEKVIISSTNYYNDGSDTTTRTYLSWPTLSTTINYYFNDPLYPFRNISEHNALDIDTEQGSSIKAAANGYVEVVEKTNSTSYNYITIRHDNGLKTRYGHLSQINVVVGEQVSRGQTIGLSGGQPGTTGSGSFSTGPHLHFEVLLNGTNVDPLRYLN